MTIGYDPAAQVARSVLYRNTGTNFVDSGAAFHNLYLGTLSWFDYDNDGRLDVIMEGNEVGTDILRIGHNTTAATNTPPSPPSNLVVQFTGANVDLSWNAATDAQTVSSGLSYNLRVGTTTGGSQIVTAQSGSNGRRRIPALGNTQMSRTAHLQGLTPGATYYWSVQSVDSAFAGSPFAPEGSFSILPESPLNISFARDSLGLVHTTWRGTPGASYRIQTSSDLHNWSTLTSLTASNGTGLFELVETPSADPPQRFYRAVFP